MLQAKSKFELFRMITPILVTLAIAILSSIYSDLKDVKHTVVQLQIDVATVKTQVNGLKENNR